jgi:preprotein translocase subunit YajC
MTESIAKNDEVVTTGGIAGRVSKVEDSFITVQIAAGVEVQVQKNAIGSLLPKGSLKF